MIYQRGTTRLVLTGASGFLGSNIAVALLRNGYQLALGSRNAEGHVDLTSWLDTHDFICSSKPDIVINCAGKRPQAYSADEAGVQSNHVIVENLVNALELNTKSALFIQIGTAAEYSPSNYSISEFSNCKPATAYGKDKLASTKFLSALGAESHIQPMILRPSTVYGPGQAPDMLIPLLRRALLSGTKIAIANPQAVRDFIHVEDLAEACIAAVKGRNGVGEIFNLSSGNPVAVSEILAKVAAISGKPVDVFADLPPAAGLQPIEDRLEISPTKFQTVFGWRASRDLDSGLRQLFSACKEN